MAFKFTIVTCKISFLKHLSWTMEIKSNYRSFYTILYRCSCRASNSPLINETQVELKNKTIILIKHIWQGIYKETTTKTPQIDNHITEILHGTFQVHIDMMIIYISHKTCTMVLREVFLAWIHHPHTIVAWFSCNIFSCRQMFAFMVSVLQKTWWVVKENQPNWTIAYLKPFPLCTSRLIGHRVWIFL